MLNKDIREQIALALRYHTFSELLEYNSLDLEDILEYLIGFGVIVLPEGLYQDEQEELRELYDYELERTYQE